MYGKDCGDSDERTTAIKLHYWHREVWTRNGTETVLEECVIESAIEDFPEDIFTGLYTR